MLFCPAVNCFLFQSAQVSGLLPTRCCRIIGKSNPGNGQHLPADPVTSEYVLGKGSQLVADGALSVGCRRRYELLY